MKKRLTAIGSIVLAAQALWAFAPPESHTQQAARGYVEEMRIVSDERNPAMVLSTPTDLMVNEKGILFTAHESEGLIRAFDPQGKYLRSFGRKGQGPGEFVGSFRFLAVVDDSVIVLNPRAPSLIVFRSDGTLVRTQKIAIDSARRSPSIIAYLSANRTFTQVSYYPTGRSPNLVDSVVYSLADSSGNRVTRLFAEGPQLSDASKPTPGPNTPYIEARPRNLAAPFGKHAFRILPPDSWGGTAAQVKILTIDRDGIQAERIVTLDPRGLTPDEIEERVAVYIADFAKIEQLKASISRSGYQPAAPGNDLVNQVRERLSRQRILPTVERALAGSDGSLWISSYSNRLEWTVLNPAGTIAYKVRVPATATVMRVALDCFWALSADIDSLPIITRNRVASAR